MKPPIRPKVIKLLARFIRPLTEEGLIYVCEEQAIISNLRHLSKRGTLLPVILPKLVDQRTASEMLGLGYSNFRKMELEGAFPFKRRILGSSKAVRFCNIDIIKYILGSDEDQEIDIEE